MMAGQGTPARIKKIIKYEPPTLEELGMQRDIMLPRKRKISKSRKNVTPGRLMSTPESYAGNSA